VPAKLAGCCQAKRAPCPDATFLLSNYYPGAKIEKVSPDEKRCRLKTFPDYAQRRTEAAAGCEIGMTSGQFGIGERRAKSRLNQPFPTRAWGTDAAGKDFEIDGVLDNISSTGLYLRIPREMKMGAEFSVVIKFLNRRDGATALLRVQVLRDELQPDGYHGLALAIKDHHFL